MFGEIGSFTDKAFFDARRYGILYYNGQEHGLEFFAFVHTDAYDSSIYRAKIIGREAREAYLDTLLRKALHTRDIQVTADDRIVLLSTCSASSTNGRDILVARIMEETRDDPFETNETDKKSGNILKVDGLPGLWARIPLWFRITMILIPFLLLLLLSLTKHKRRARRKNHRGDE
jgi:sortase B